MEQELVEMSKRERDVLKVVKRTVANDYTIRFENQVYQLLPPVWPGERFRWFRHGCGETLRWNDAGSLQGQVFEASAGGPASPSARGGGDTGVPGEFTALADPG